MTFTADQPSPRYTALLDQYQAMHEKGDPQDSIAPEDMFSGLSILEHITLLRAVTYVLSPRTVLDYGAGKAKAYDMPDAIQIADGTKASLKDFLGIDAVTYYDPGYARLAGKPNGPFDGVISTDVLEHCPEEDLPWIVREIFGFARDFVFLTIAGYPATKTLPNGENAHVTVRPIEWWQSLLDREIAQHPGLRYFAVYDQTLPVGSAQKVIKSRNFG